jgi:hypothetical protein
VLARGVRAVIPRFFYAAEIPATEMLLFFRKSAAMDILTIQGRRGAGATLNRTDGGKGDAGGQCGD